MELKPNFSTLGVWNLLSSGQVTATTFNVNGKEKHDPIPDQVVSTGVSAKAIAVFCNTQSYSKDSWQNGGIAHIGISNSLFANYSIVKSEKLTLRKTTIITIPDVANQYQIIITPPPWFWDFTYSVYTYTGSGMPDNSEKLNYLGGL